MQYPALDGKVLFAEPTVTPYDPTYATSKLSPVEYRFNFLNYTNKPISVATRQGMRYEITNLLGVHTRSDFVVQMEITVRDGAKYSLDWMLARITEDSCPNLKVLKEAYLGQRKTHNPFSSTVLVIDYPVTLEALQQLGGEVYYSDLDLYLSLEPPNRMRPHPYSEEGRRQAMVIEAPALLDKSSFGYCVELIDSTAKSHPHFINIANQVYRVEPKRDPSRRDGFYVSSSLPVVGDVARVEDGECRRIELTDPNLPKYGIYTCFADAAAQGDVVGNRKTELAELEHAIASAKLENLRLVTELERSEAERKEKSAELDSSKKQIEHYRELQRLRLKDEYEERNYGRKDQSEVIKILPSLIVGVGAILVAFASLFKKSE